ncbi:MAG TPA: hypothetical protein VG897_02165, partial [Terriglobales bacterium]|nr:hypothetical protein [Terriglobales bacterium]
LPSIVLLAGACVLNCCAADYWEWDSHRILVRYPHRTTQFIARNLLVLTAGSSAISALLFLVKPDPTIAAAFLTLAFLMLIAKTTHRLQPETRRFLVDLALCTPVLFLMK